VVPSAGHSRSKVFNHHQGSTNSGSRFIEHPTQARLYYMRYWKSDNAVKLNQFCAGIRALALTIFEDTSNAYQ